MNGYKPLRFREVLKASGCQNEGQQVQEWDTGGNPLSNTGKENGNYYISFRALGFRVMAT